MTLDYLDELRSTQTRMKRTMAAMAAAAIVLVGAAAYVVVSHGASSGAAPATFSGPVFLGGGGPNLLDLPLATAEANLTSYYSTSFPGATPNISVVYVNDSTVPAAIDGEVTSWSPGGSGVLSANSTVTLNVEEGGYTGAPPSFPG